MDVTIHKHKLISSTTELQLPIGSEILSAGLDPNGEVCIWAVTPTQELELEPRLFLAAATGQTISREALKQFIATVKDGPFMWHIWEILQ